MIRLGAYVALILLLALGLAFVRRDRIQNSSAITPSATPFPAVDAARGRHCGGAAFALTPTATRKRVPGPVRWERGLLSRETRDFEPTSPCEAVDVEIPNAAPISLLIQNRGATDDRLLGGGSPLAERVDLHQTLLVHGVRDMTTAPDGLVIGADATTILEPGSDHLMLVGLQRDLVQGDAFPLTLHFARAGEVAVQVRVRRRVDAAGITPFPPVVAGDLAISLASSPPVGLWATPAKP